MSAGELAERFDMTKPTVSHHFAALKKADLIRSRRSGQQIIYSLNTTVMQDMLAKIYDLFGVGVDSARSQAERSGDQEQDQEQGQNRNQNRNRDGEGHSS